PPQPMLKCEEALDYVYLLEFDILQDTREDVQQQKWATPGNRLIMMEFFKLIQAEEELNHHDLHVEIQHLITNMADEEREILDKAEELQLENPAFALQLWSYWNEHG
ncbi:hypothetical protein BDP27DRAFT_1140403, partial [Rhodocollybia butyracea]